MCAAGEVVPLWCFTEKGVASRRQSTIWLKIEGNSIANKVKGRAGGRARLKGTCKGTVVSAGELSVTRRAKRKWPACMVKRQVPAGEYEECFERTTGMGCALRGVSGELVVCWRSRPRLPRLRPPTLSASERRLSALRPQCFTD
jgi:hypothetical protein